MSNRTELATDSPQRSDDTGGLFERLRFLLPIVCGLVVAGLTFAGLSVVYPQFWATDDGIRDLLLARDCAELGYCHTLGSPTSLPGFYQGAVWTQLLAAVQTLGGGAEEQRVVVLALASLATGTLFVVVFRWLRPSLALPAATIFALGLTKDHLPAQLASGGASALPVVIFSAALLALGLTGRMRFLLIASLGLSVAINEHTVSLAMLPALSAVAILASPRPRRALSIAFAVMSVVCVVTSAAATRANLLALYGHPVAVPLAVAGLVAIPLVAKLGESFRRCRPTVRALVVGVLTLFPIVSGAAFLFAVGHQFSSHYLNPILATGATVAAAVLCAPFEIASRWAGWLRWIPTLAATALVGVGLVRDDGIHELASRYESPWSLEDAEAVVESIQARGWSFDDVVFRLQSVACRELVIRMSLFAQPPQRQPRAPVLQIHKRAGGDQRRPEDPALEIAEVDSWLVPAELRACRERVGGGGRVCESAKALGSIPKPALFSARSYPEIHLVDLPPPYRAIYEIPVRPLAQDARQILVDDGGEVTCGWKVVEARGLEVDRPLPSDRVVVRSDGSAAATLVLARTYGTAECNADFDLRYPPCIIEAAYPWPRQDSPGGSR